MYFKHESEFELYIYPDAHTFSALVDADTAFSHESVVLLYVNPGLHDMFAAILSITLLSNTQELPLKV